MQGVQGFPPHRESIADDGTQAHRESAMRRVGRERVRRRIVRYLQLKPVDVKGGKAGAQR